MQLLHHGISEQVPLLIEMHMLFNEGFIRTPMAHAVPEKVLSEMKRRIAMRRLGKAEDVANLALFLASSERSGYITGETFECSGMLRL